MKQIVFLSPITKHTASFINTVWNQNSFQGRWRKTSIVSLWLENLFKPIFKIFEIVDTCSICAYLQVTLPNPTTAQRSVSKYRENRATSADVGSDLADILVDRRFFVETSK